MDNIAYGNDAAIDALQDSQDDQLFLDITGLQSLNESEAMSGRHDQWPYPILSPSSFPSHINFDDGAALIAKNRDLSLELANVAFDHSHLGHLSIATADSMPAPAIPIVTTQPRKRISNELWAAQKENIRTLFITQGLTLSETMKIMEESHQFSAS
jgi:hypothetical protein